MLSNIEEVAQKHGLSLGEVALRWLSHHSQLKREHGDAVIIGASSMNHIEQVSVNSYPAWQVLICRMCAEPRRSGEGPFA